jgi:hypothetical protein
MALKTGNLETRISQRQSIFPRCWISAAFAIDPTISSAQMQPVCPRCWISAAFAIGYDKS